MIRYLDWRHLRAVDLVARSGSATAAARRLGVSQPSISRSLREAAQYAGQPLFRRAGGGLIALEPAQILRSALGRLTREVKDLRSALARLSGELTGRVSVGVLPFSEQDLIPELFGRLSAEHPHLRLLAIYGTYNMLAEALLRGEIDCMVGLLREPSPFADLVEIPLYEECYTAVAGAAHPVHDSPVGRAALGKARWVVAPHGTPVRAYFETLFDGDGAAPAAQTCEMHSFDSAEKILLASDLIALLTYSDRKRRKMRPGLKPLDLDLPDPAVTVGLTVPRGREPSDAVEAFRAGLAARAPG